MRNRMCQHQPLCPPADATDCEAARAAAHQPAQGWTLSNGVLIFEDTGELLADGRIIEPHRPLSNVRGLRHDPSMPWSAVVTHITDRRGEEPDSAAMLGFRPGGGGLCYLDQGPPLVPCPQLVRELRGVTAIDLEREIAAARL